MGESGRGGVEQAESPLARLRYRRLCVQWRKGDGRPADTEKCETRVQSIWRRAQLAELADLSFEVRTDVVPRLIFHRKDDSQPRVRQRAPFDGAAGSRSLICSLAGSAAQLECGSGVCREKRCRLRIDGECRAQ